MPKPVTRLAPDAALCYQQAANSAREAGWQDSMTLRWGLSPLEEARALGSPRTSSVAKQSVLMRRRLYEALEIRACPVPLGFVEQEEQGLLGLVVRQQRAAPANCITPLERGAPGTATLLPPYPLSPTEGAKPLEQETHKELQESWEAHHKILAQGQLAPAQGALEHVQDCQVRKGTQGQSAAELLVQPISRRQRPWHAALAACHQPAALSPSVSFCSLSSSLRCRLASIPATTAAATAGSHRGAPACS